MGKIEPQKGSAGNWLKQVTPKKAGWKRPSLPAHLSATQWADLRHYIDQLDSHGVREQRKELYGLWKRLQGLADKPRKNLLAQRAADALAVVLHVTDDAELGAVKAGKLPPKDVDLIARGTPGIALQIRAQCLKEEILTHAVDSFLHDELFSGGTARVGAKGGDVALRAATAAPPPLYSLKPDAFLKKRHVQLNPRQLAQVAQFVAENYAEPITARLSQLLHMAAQTVDKAPLRLSVYDLDGRRFLAVNATFAGSFAKVRTALEVGSEKDRAEVVIRTNRFSPTFASATPQHATLDADHQGVIDGLSYAHMAKTAVAPVASAYLLTARSLKHASVLAAGSKSLEYATAERPLEGPVVRVLAAQIAEPLQNLHALGKIHRDVKMDNVIVTAQQFALADFDLCADIAALRREPRRMMGTRQYAAPEVFRKDELTAACDIWSLGMTLFLAASAHDAPMGHGTTAEIEQSMQAYSAWHAALPRGPVGLDLAAIVQSHPVGPRDPFDAFLAEIHRTLPQDGSYLLEHLLHPEPQQRSTAAQVMQHFMHQRSYQDDLMAATNFCAKQEPELDQQVEKAFLNAVDRLHLVP